MTTAPETLDLQRVATRHLELDGERWFGRRTVAGD
jgi:hypothetical protein